MYVTDTSFCVVNWVWGPLVLSFYCLFLLESQLFKDILKNVSGCTTLLVAACGVWFPDQGLNLNLFPPLHWEQGLLATGVMVYGGRNWLSEQVTSLRSRSELKTEPGFKAWSSGTRTRVSSSSLQDPAKGSRAGDPDLVALKPPNGPIHLTRERRASCFLCSQT